MTAYDYLSQYGILLKRVNYLEARATNLRYEYNLAGVTGIRYDKDKIISSPSNTFESKMAKYLDAIDEIVDEYYQQKIQAERTLMEINDKLLELALKYPRKKGTVEVLRLRYLKGLRYEQIAVETCYDFDYVRRLNADGLTLFYETYQEELNLVGIK